MAGKTARQLPNYVPPPLVAHFKETKCSNVADFCLEMYRRMGLLEGLRVERSSMPEFRARAVAVSDYFVDQPYEGEIVRARYRDGKLLLHKGGNRFLEIPGGEFGPKQISPTRDTRFCWMQSVIRCTHYVAGASEQHYINKEDASNVKFISATKFLISIEPIRNCNGIGAVQNWDCMFSVDWRKWDFGDGPRVRISAARS